jgi:hypothetical protein
LAVAVLENDSNFFDIGLDLVGDRDLYVRYELDRIRLQVKVRSESSKLSFLKDLFFD